MYLKLEAGRIKADVSSCGYFNQLLGIKQSEVILHNCHMRRIAWAFFFGFNVLN
jgi:hypothetical protein